MDTKKILITFGEHPELGLILPLALLAEASQIIAQAQIVKPDNSYKSDPAWEPSDANAMIRVIEGRRIEPPSAALLEARKEAETNNNRWYSEYEAHNKAKAEVAALKAQVEALVAAGTCHAVPSPASGDISL